MRKREFGKYYLVCNLENNKCVEVRHNDFGPAFYFFTRGRIIDLSRDAFDKIANLEKGLIRVRIGAVYPAKMKDERDNFDYGAGIEPKIHAYGG
jgi:rare lipoprotein A